MASRPLPVHRLIWVAIVLLLIMNPAGAAEEAGLVIIASGNVTAQLDSEPPRPLNRRSKFFVGDLLHVDEGAKAQVRFRDGTIISLQSGTQLKVDAFRYDEAVGKDNVSNIVTLLKGGFRTITGAVSKKNPAAYRVNTPVASIGVRGTNYSVVIADDLYVGVWDGGIDVRNDAGSIDLGADQAYSFAQISGSNEAPQGLFTVPQVLLETVSVRRPAKTGGSEHAEANPDDAPATGDDGADDAGTAAVEDDGATDWSELKEGEVTALVAVNDGTADPTGVVSTGSTSLTGQRNEYEATTCDAAADASCRSSTGVGGYTGSTELVDSSQTSGGTNTDLRLSSTEAAALTRFGFAAVTDSSGSALFRGKAIDGSTGSPVIADNGLLPGDMNYDTATATAVLRQGSASAFVAGSNSTYGAAWGKWDASVLNPALTQDDPADPSVTTAYADPVYWLTFQPTDAAVMGLATGSARYRNVIGYQGSGTGGVVGPLYLAMDVDFATGNVGGDMKLHTDTGNFWNISFDGAVQGNRLDLAVDSASSVLVSPTDGTVAAGGTIQALFTGAAAEGIAGLYAFQDMNGLGVEVHGTFLADKTSIGDLRLSSAEVASIDRTGLAALAGNPGSVMRGTANSGSAGDPILLDGQLDPDSGLPVRLLRSDNAIQSTASGTTVGSSEVYWGHWNASIVNDAGDYHDGDDPLLVRPVVDDVYWMTVEPAAATVLADHARNNRTGSWSGTVTAFNGANSVGSAVDGLSFDANIDFATGSITGAVLNASAGSGTEIWSVFFQGGTLNGANLDLAVDATASTVLGPLLTDNHVTGRLAGTLTGGNAEGLGAAFHVHALEDSRVQLNGTFLSTGTVTP